MSQAVTAFSTRRSVLAAIPAFGIALALAPAAPAAAQEPTAEEVVKALRDVGLTPFAGRNNGQLVGGVYSLTGFSEKTFAALRKMNDYLEYRPDRHALFAAACAASAT